jgi:hypothetical protein
MATSGLHIDCCQNQKQHETDCQNKTLPFHVTPPNVSCLIHSPTLDFGQMRSRAKRVPQWIASDVSHAKGLAALYFSNEGILSNRFLTRAGDSGLGKRYKFFLTKIRVMQEMLHQV